MGGQHVYALDDNLCLLRGNRNDRTLLALFLTGKNDCGVALLYMQSIHQWTTSLQYFRSQGQDLHEVLVTQLSCHRPKDTGALRVLVFTNDNSCIFVETDVAAV